MRGCFLLPMKDAGWGGSAEKRAWMGWSGCAHLCTNVTEKEETTPWNCF